MKNPKLHRIGVGGPLNAGKARLVQSLCVELQGTFSIGVVTNTVVSRKDLNLHKYIEVLGMNRITIIEGEFNARKVQQGVCQLVNRVCDLDIIIFEGIGDRNDASFSLDCVDIAVFVVDGTEDIRQFATNRVGIRSADIVVVSKIDTIPRKLESVGRISIGLQEVRGARASVFISSVTGFGLDKLVEYFKEKVRLQ